MNNNKQNNILSAKEARELTLTSTVFETQLFKNLKHEALGGYNSMPWDCTNIDSEIVQKTYTKLLELGYEVLLVNERDDEGEVFEVIMYISW